MNDQQMTILSLSWTVQILQWFGDLPKMASSRNNKCAHEFIMDFSEIRKKTGIVEEDIAKRLQVRWANCQGPMKSFRWLEDVTVEAGAPGS